VSKRIGWGAKRLIDGERRTIKPQGLDKNIRVEVIAYRADSETPYVILKKGDEEWYFEDSFADELIARIRYALAILPTSK
jgi:hypothetical protein